MPALSLKNIPDQLYSSLKSSASRNHRSISSEILFRLEQSMQQEPVDPKDVLARIKKIRHKIDNAPLLDEKILKKAISEGI